MVRFISFICGFVVLCFLWGIYSAPMWRYRLIVDVDTPEGKYSAASVIQVNVDESRRRLRVTGEAVSVDLGKRGNLFVLLRSEQNIDNASAIVPATFPGPPPGTPDGIKYYTTLRAEADVPGSAMPMLVSFLVMHDPKTIAPIDSANLASTFGPGVRLEHVYIQMVPAGIWPFSIASAFWPVRLAGTPVTRTVQSLLPWLSKHPEPRLLPISNRFDHAPMSNLTHGDFLKE